MDTPARLAAKVRELYSIVDELEKMHPGRRFTLDGHLVGSIGEVLAAYMYDLSLLPVSSETHDAVSRDHLLVQIKATQIKRISMSSNPDYLLVLAINSEGQAEEVYNGPGQPAWDACGKLQKNGQRVVCLAKLKGLMAEILVSEQLEKVEKD